MWSGTRVLVTGGRGFLGQHLVSALEGRGAVLWAPPRSELDLLDRAATEAALRGWRPRVVIHAAVQGGGIGWMREHPVESGRDSALINLHAMDAALKAGVEVFVGVSSACAYPRDCPVPFAEERIWDGPPEPTNGPYAQSKRLMLELGHACSTQYGMRTVAPVLGNLYGPGDSLLAERAHVVAGLLLRMLAQPADLQVWGTGRATRELLYVRDAAEGILFAAERWLSPMPINVGTGQELRISALVEALVAATGFRGPIHFDASHPDGQPRKCMSVDRLTRLGWRAPTSLEAGLRATVAWYREALESRGTH